ncbi:MAG TPA: cellulose synthase family protein [Thermoanaerobaculia bacterium]|nr:cellulose synthase family protein [Thermoanaerobaculia bacterium]
MKDPLSFAILAAYYAVLAPLALYGLHRVVLLVVARRPSPTAPAPAKPSSLLPLVTVQLPLYNERYVARRLLDAVAGLDYPSERLEIQVLDDSTDDTTSILRARVEELRAQGLDVVLVHRCSRAGFKAGALAAGLGVARGELIVVFDADFLPPTDFLQRTVPCFVDPGVGMVQARWGHVNRGFSLLTRVQALLLDAHFLIEHAARARAGCFFNFNGTAGVWRRSTIEDAGGWQHDTLTEDLDLSYRAQLRGCRFVFLDDLVAPAELPVEIAALRGQQRRWTRGSVQCLRKLGGALCRAPIPWRIRAEALAHLGANLCYPLMVALTLLLLPAMWVRRDVGFGLAWLDLPMLIAATGSLVAFYLTAAARAGTSRREAAVLLPVLMALGIGMSWHNARAALGGLVRRGGEFERTPKYDVRGRSDRWRDRRYRPRRNPRLTGEVVLAAYTLCVVGAALVGGMWWSLPFLLLFFAGYAYVLGLAALASHQRDSGGVGDAAAAV